MAGLDIKDALPVTFTSNGLVGTVRAVVVCYVKNHVLKISKLKLKDKNNQC